MRFPSKFLGLIAAVAVGTGVMAADSQTVTLRRISPDQYRQIIADVFGPDIRVGGRFEPDQRDNGLLALGSAKVSVSNTGFEQYEAMARTIAAQIIERREVVPCKPANPQAADDACATKFFSATGRLLYRRPLTALELKAQVSAANIGAERFKDFYVGLEASLSTMLSSPQFLFRREVAGPDAKLDAYSIASKLSFLLWNASPDLPLLAAAESGALNTPKGYTAQVERMLASPRLEAGVRAFFTDMLNFDHFDQLEKDASIYPKFSLEVTRDAKEETLRTLVDLLITNRGDYRDIFTTKKTVLTPILASVYAVPLPRTDVVLGERDVWIPYEYPANDPRAGILTHISFVALHSHAGRSSPTIRGKALREIMLCQKVPDPPGNVNFTVVQDTNNPDFKTARERLNAHATEAMCTGCHKLTDPMGLALEQLDGGGGFRTHENGAMLDTTGVMDGKPFKNAIELGRVVHDSPAATNCIVNRMASYALGKPAVTKTAWLKELGTDFAKDGYRIPDLLRHIVTSEEFVRVTPAAETAK